MPLFNVQNEVSLKRLVRLIVPDRGQGLNNAITDAADFLVHLREMKEHTPEELAAAVKRYEVELWPRGNEAVLASHENTNAVHDWKTMMKSPLFTDGLAKISKEEQAAKDAEEAKAASESKKWTLGEADANGMEKASASVSG